MVQNVNFNMGNFQNSFVVKPARNSVSYMWRTIKVQKQGKFLNAITVQFSRKVEKAQSAIGPSMKLEVVVQWQCLPFDFSFFCLQFDTLYTF